MKNFFYLIWADAIISNRKYDKNSTNWKLSLFFLITMCNALNFYTILIWLKFIYKFSYTIEIDFFPGTILDNATVFIIQFALPFIILNYFLIFYKDRYKKIIQRYPKIKGRPALIYGLISIWVGVISALLYGSLT